MGRLSGRSVGSNNSMMTWSYPQFFTEMHAQNTFENTLYSGSKVHNLSENGINSVNPSLESSSDVVANCYLFKSRLQEYAQKVGISTPVYDTLMEGPSHVPVFSSSVLVNNIKYDSLPGFFNRKAAEQSAAEVALVELAKSGQLTENIPTVHETGLCKNLLQEYAQKMNYAIPSYNCTKQATGSSNFTCTVEINGIQYIGAAAKTKKEAEIKAARTALLAIQTSWGTCGTSPYTVLPGKKKGRETEPAKPEAEKPLKPKKNKFKSKWMRKRNPRKKKDQLLCSEVASTEGIVSAVDNAEAVAPALAQRIFQQIIQRSS